MVYQGSKARIAKDIVPILQECKEVSVLQKSDRKKGDRATEKLFVVKGGLR